MTYPTIWSIAGSDCTAGAGIQADVKTMHNLGANPCTIVTATTAQNSNGVIAINPVSEDILTSQFNALIKSSTPKAIKIGMLANIGQVKLVVTWLKVLKNGSEQTPFVVYDPVAIASNGDALTDEDILPTVKAELFPLVDLITPNAGEAQHISKEYIIGWDSVHSIAKQFINSGINNVIIKGGHVDVDLEHCVDHCLSADNLEQHSYWLASPRVETQNSHGSGCTFASAMATFIAHGYHIRDAFILSKAYINQGLAVSKDQPGCHGAIHQGNFPTTLSDFPQVLVNDSPLAQAIDWQQDSANSYISGFNNCEHTPLGLYPVVDSTVWIERLLKSGVKTIQLRVKHLTDNELKAEIKTAISIGKKYNAQVFINDHWQLAIELGAYGVHLGQEDIGHANLTAIKNANIRLGISTHGHYELLKVKQMAPSYLAVGAIFTTKTKDMTGQIQGLTALQQINQLVGEIPLTAIGGITLDNVESVLATGVKSIAVVTAITEADAPEHVVKSFNLALKAN
ncbi:thiamine phosphate synthase [Thalassotalea psychrophila]|uniref:Thiamine-phosphate synthase n=1 Tax=Thalassotalea psychrophila TaxID=3065647 RepID=A0ABY9TP35_9GAMM|nr:thiamine phosphate synthase [Colwelliaceae bacterium SQ149]